MIKKISTE